MSSVSASSIDLSVRQRSMRGKRTAMPDLWRGLRLNAFEADFEDERRRDAAHRPEFSTVVLRTIASTLAHFLVGQARVGLRERHPACARPVPSPRPRRRT